MSLESGIYYILSWGYSRLSALNTPMLQKAWNANSPAASGQDCTFLEF